MSLLQYRRPAISLLLMLSVALVACQEKAEEKPAETHAGPPVLNPGMRAYVDPVTGEYAPAPPATEQPQPLVPAAGLTSPVVSPPKETPLPDGGVMIELGDQFQTEGRSTK